MRLIDADKVKELIRGPLSVDRDTDKEYVCGLIDKIESGWISVKDRLPEEKPSMWSPLYGGAKWREGLMWKVESERVLVAIRFPDGTGVVRTGKTADGKWHTDVSPVLEQTVTHWMPMPTMPEADT